MDDKIIDVQSLKRVLLISPSAEIPDGRIDPPLGLCYLSAMVKDTHSVYGRNYLGEHWKDAEPKIKKDLEDLQPDIVGIQCLTYNRTACFVFDLYARKVFAHRTKVGSSAANPACSYRRFCILHVDRS